jgi:hypothetical protein
MNGKQAKRLRRAAMGLAVSLTEAGKQISKDGYVAKMHSKVVPVATEEGQKMERFSVPQVFIKPDSVKAIYRKLKSGRV